MRLVEVTAYYKIGNTTILVMLTFTCHNAMDYRWFLNRFLVSLFNGILFIPHRFPPLGHTINQYTNCIFFTIHYTTPLLPVGFLISGTFSNASFMLIITQFFFGCNLVVFFTSVSASGHSIGTRQKVTLSPSLWCGTGQPLGPQENSWLCIMSIRTRFWHPAQVFLIATTTPKIRKGHHSPLLLSNPIISANLFVVYL